MVLLIQNSEAQAMRFLENIFHCFNDLIPLAISCGAADVGLKRSQRPNGEDTNNH